MTAQTLFHVIVLELDDVVARIRRDRSNLYVGISTHTPDSLAAGLTDNRFRPTWARGHVTGIRHDLTPQGPLPRDEADTIARDLIRQLRTKGYTVNRNTTAYRTYVINLHDPVRDAQLHAALDAQVASLRQRDGAAEIGHDLLKVDAVMELVTTAGTFKDGHSADVTVIIGWKTLMNGIHDLTVCETSSGVPLPVATIQKLCCDATIHLVTVDKGSVPLNMGHSERSATKAQRRALMAIHSTCAHPDCTVSVNHCQFHHITPWEQNGPTDLDNLVPLCSKHHHLAHEGMWTIHLKPDRSIVWTQPNGQTYFDGHTIDRIPRPPDREH